MATPPNMATTTNNHRPSLQVFGKLISLLHDVRHRNQSSASCDRCFGPEAECVCGRNTNPPPPQIYKPLLQTAPSMSNQTSEHSRLALIDAEILRCKGEMALVEEAGGGLRARKPVRRSHSRGRSKEPERTLPWDERLKAVGVLVTEIDTKGIAPRLYDNVTLHLTESTAELLKVNPKDDNSWNEFIDNLIDCRDYYKDKADTLSIYDVPQSPYHLFDAIASGMNFEKREAKGQASSDERERWIELLLSNVGKEVERVAQNKEYFDQAISRGSGVIFLQIAHTLQGRGVKGGAIRKVGGGDWRKALVGVFEKVKKLAPYVKGRFVMGVYKQVLARLGATIKKLASLPANSLVEDEVWKMIHDRLTEKMDFFLIFSEMPYVGRMFDAIGTGLKKVILPPDVWFSHDPSERDGAMCNVLNSIGEELAGLRDADYGFLSRDGASIMRDIAVILKSVD